MAKASAKTPTKRKTAKKSTGATPKSGAGEKALVIVESPAKARTVGRFLGKDYLVAASMGHVRDLPAKSLGVDVENDFKPIYQLSRDKASVVKDIKTAAATAKDIYLATDPDREGEAISWHLVEASNIKQDDARLKRIVFHEITKTAIEKAFNNPRDIDYNLVNAQQARRVLDRIVGYQVSPVLWEKVKRGRLSAGRVQSVALRLIVEREQEVEKFDPKEYWVITTLLDADKGSFVARLHALPNAKAKDRAHVPDQKVADVIVADLKKSAYAVASVTQKKAAQKPRAPFITSTLQQEAARRFHFNAQRTMRIAQALYEGMRLGDGQPTGLITYMRTDSTNLSTLSLQSIQAFIKSEYGTQYAAGPRQYRTKSRNAQEAHEAIRPVDVMHTPKRVAPHLSKEQAQLYELIWKRTIASQMVDARLLNTTVDINATASADKVYTLRVQGSVVEFDGFRIIYVEAEEPDQSDEKNGATTKSPMLPPLTTGQALALAKDGVKAEQKYTQPPPRYSEAMLIQTLEKEGIGRPSTYASIVGTIETREYVEREKAKFKPTPLGKSVCKFLMQNFPDIMDLKFTAGMEKKLDSIAQGTLQWVPMLRDFHGPLEKSIASAKKATPIDRSELDEATDEVCEVCERPMVLKSGRYGRFLSCSGYPECKNARPMSTPADSSNPPPNETTDEVCEVCERPMVVKSGRYGRFLSCSGYPECKHTSAIPTHITCPECKTGELDLRYNKKGKPFYGCNRYPKCRFITGKEPLATPCPKCEGLLTKQPRSDKAVCVNGDCKWSGSPP